jgi:nicotinate phosphoribosyltransferase
VLFPDEPLIRITAPAPQAQLVETRLLTVLHFQTLIASKAARMRLAAPDALLVDFGLRRAHGGEAGVMAARAAYIAGFDGTASMPAGLDWGIPLYGTMAHSFVQAHESEEAAFLAFARARPEDTVFLLDTYDIACATETVVRIAPVLAAEGIAVKGVRIDSGDLAAEARRVRARLDAAGLRETKVMVSGGLDEHDIAALSGAPIDGYGLGTSLVTSADRPALEIAYKLKSYAGAPQRKLSAGKAYWPGATQAWRRLGPDGRMAEDRLAPAHDDSLAAEDFTPLLRPVLRGGARVAAAPSLDAIRAHARAEMATLPDALRALRDAPAYPVRPSPALEVLAAEFDRARGAGP